MKNIPKEFWIGYRLQKEGKLTPGMEPVIPDEISEKIPIMLPSPIANPPQPVPPAVIPVPVPAPAVTEKKVEEEKKEAINPYLAALIGGTGVLGLRGYGLYNYLMSPLEENK